MTLMNFATTYAMPKELSEEPTLRRKQVVAIVRPYYSPDYNGPNYENYCHQKLMLYVSFRQISDLLGEHSTYAMVYAAFLQSTDVSHSLEDDVRHLAEQDDEPSDTESNTSKVKKFV